MRLHAPHRQPVPGPNRGIHETLWPTGNKAPMAPAPAHHRGSRRHVLPSTPPSASTGPSPRRASRAQRIGPSARRSGWLRVGNAGLRNARARLARRRPGIPWAAAVRACRAGPGLSRRWPPATPAYDTTSRRARHSRLLGASGPVRQTTPQSPRSGPRHGSAHRTTGSE
jgi:hypothetical protein